MNVHGETMTRPRMPGATGRRRPQRTMHRSVSGPPFSALPKHFSLYGETSYGNHFKTPAYVVHPEENSPRTQRREATRAAAASEEAADVFGTSQLPWPPPQEAERSHEEVLASTRFPPVGQTSQPSFRRVSGRLVHTATPRLLWRPALVVDVLVSLKVPSPWSISPLPIPRPLSISHRPAPHSASVHHPPCLAGLVQDGDDCAPCAQASPKR